MMSARHIDNLVAQAEESLLLRQLSEAASLARSVLAETPMNPRALHVAGLVAAVAGDVAAAAEYLAKAVDAEPLCSGWHADLAVVLFSAHRLRKSEEHALRALALDSECALSHNLLAKMASRQGRHHRAREHILALAALRPDD